MSPKIVWRSTLAECEYARGPDMSAMLRAENHGVLTVAQSASTHSSITWRTSTSPA
jgi:hypothetical protein